MLDLRKQWCDRCRTYCTGKPPFVCLLHSLRPTCQHHLHCLHQLTTTCLLLPSSYSPTLIRRHPSLLSKCAPCPAKAAKIFLASSSILSAVGINFPLASSSITTIKQWTLRTWMPLCWLNRPLMSLISIACEMMMMKVVIRFLTMAGLIGGAQGIGRIIYCDNWYTSMDLVTALWTSFGFFCVGTYVLSKKKSRVGRDFPFAKLSGGAMKAFFGSRTNFNSQINNKCFDKKFVILGQNISLKKQEIIDIDLSLCVFSCANGWWSLAWF